VPGHPQESESRRLWSGVSRKLMGVYASVSAVPSPSPDRRYPPKPDSPLRPSLYRPIPMGEPQSRSPETEPTTSPQRSSTRTTGDSLVGGESSRSTQTCVEGKRPGGGFDRRSRGDRPPTGRSQRSRSSDGAPIANAGPRVRRRYGRTDWDIGVHRGVGHLEWEVW